MEWIASDGLLRTRDEMVDEAVQALGYRRRGRVIVDRLTTAARRQIAAADKRKRSRPSVR